ncbi:MAG TPA: TetR/AcrR family transcriptional regulator [Solirubrobacteraceae bacterium]|jgi:AcrR family transcriptional regulator|nr:TetR/AcrR family transcriptional regulator [Solirubrobacteraceae bacterium]
MSSEETRSALLKAAKRLVFERGYAGTSVRDLVSEAGANLGAVNYHFGSRENLLNQAMFEFFLEWGESVGQIEVAPGAGPIEQLAARARPMVDGIAPAQPLFVVFLEGLLQSRHSPSLRRELAEHYNRQREQASERIRASPGAAEMAPRTAEVIASYMLAVADGLQIQALIDPESVPTGDELAAFYEGMAAAARSDNDPPKILEKDQQ